MASGEGSKLLKENIEGSNGSTPNYGSSAEYLTASACSEDYFTASISSEAKDKNDISELTQSSPAVLEASSSQAVLEPSSKPSVLEPSSKPAVLEPSSKPSVQEPSSKPAVLEPSSKPAVLEPSSKPAVLEPSSKPAVLEPSSKPAVLEPSSKPAVLEPSSKPAVLEPSSKPAVLEPSSKPAVLEPSSKPAVLEPSSKPEVLEPSSGPAVLEPSSSPGVLEPSSSQSDGRPKSLFGKRFLRPWSQPSAKEVAISSSTESNSSSNEQQSSGEYQNMRYEREISTSSSSDSHNREDEPLLHRENRTNQQQTDDPQTNSCVSCLKNFVNYYMKCARAIDHSCFVGIFQLSIVIVCIATITIGIVFFKSCEGKYRSLNPFLDILIGVFGLCLSYLWLKKVCREDRGQRFWNHDKNRLILFLSLVLFLMTLEFVFFSQMIPVNLQSSQVQSKCPKTYYYYLYYMHMVNAGFLALASLLYLPAFCVYVSNYRRLEPSPQNGHFQPL